MDDTQKLVDVALGDGDALQRVMAIHRLAMVHREGIEDVLYELADQPDPDVRRAAAQALRLRGREDAAPPGESDAEIRQQMRSSDATTRERAALRCMNRDLRALEHDVIDLLDDPEPAVREAAAYALTGASTKATPQLVRMLAVEHNRRSRDAAALALAGIASEEALRALAAAAVSGASASVRRSARMGLAAASTFGAQEILSGTESDSTLERARVRRALIRCQFAALQGNVLRRLVQRRAASTDD